MTYHRVLPRDLFNEAKLLKCVGKIALLVSDNIIKGLSMEYEQENTGFIIDQNESDGSIFIRNLRFYDDKSEIVTFKTPLNSKENFPLIMEYKGNEYYPLNMKGEYQLDANLFT